MSYKKIPIPQKAAHTSPTEPPEPNDDDDIDFDEAGDESVKALSHPSYEALEAKLNEVEEQLNAANSALIEQKNQFVRHQAELENIRKRSEKDVQKAYQYSLE